MPALASKTVAVSGAGAQAAAFLRLALMHPHLELVGVSGGEVGQPVCERWAQLRGACSLSFGTMLPPADIHVYCDAAPAQATAEIQVQRGGTGGVYGVPELRRGALAGARVIEWAGDLATGVVLALSPLLQTGALQGKELALTALLSRYSEVGTLTGHPQQAELSQLPGRFPIVYAGVSTSSPLTRTVIQAWMPDGYSDRDIWALWRDAYGGNQGVGLLREPERAAQEWSWLVGGARCELSCELETETGRLLIATALDPLGKGGAAQAMQSLNIALGWPEWSGIDVLGQGYGLAR